MLVVVKDIIGENCITIADGEKIYNIIHPRLQDHIDTSVDLRGTTIAAPFLNAAFGKLYEDIPKDVVDEHLDLIIVEHRNIVERVMHNAHRYHTDPEYRYSVNKVIKEYVSDNI